MTACRPPTPYQLRALQQAVEWADGRPRHNIVDDECCPDFSCCTPGLFEVDRTKRNLYVEQYRRKIGAPE